MNNTNTLAIIISLLVGFSFGYVVWGTQANQLTHNDASYDAMHQMPDGSMMSNESHMDMDEMMDGMMAALEGKTGDDFDKAFLAEMIVHHQGAVVMAQAVLEQSQRPELIQLANEIISAQNKEIEMMQEWENEWFR